MKSPRKKAARPQAAATQLEALRAVGEEIARELHLPSLLNLIHRHAMALVGSTSGAVYLWDESAEVLVPGAWHGAGGWFRDVRIRLGEGVAGSVARQRRGMIVNDYPATPFALPLLLERVGMAAVLAEPLVYREQLVGVISVNRGSDEGRFKEADRRLLALFASQAAIAIANAQAHATVLRRTSELAALLRAGRSIMAGLDLQEILDRIVTEAGPIAGTPHVKLLLIDKPAQVLRVHAVSGACRGKGFEFPLGEGLSGWVATAGTPLFVPECHQDPRNVFAAHDGAMGFRTYLGLPIKGRDEILGVLAFSGTEPRQYTVEEVAYLTSFADQAAVALQNARLYQVVSGRVAEMETLREIDRAITSEMELPAVLDAVVAGAMRLLGSGFAQIILWDEASQGLCYGAASGPEAERIRRQRFVLGRGINGVVAETRRPMLLDDYQASPYVVPECADVVATITVPVLFGDRLLGVLHSHTTQVGKQFTLEDLRRLQALAGAAAIAMEHARLYRETREHLGKLQGFYQATKLLTSERFLDTLLQQAVEVATRAIGARYGAIALVDAAGQVHRVVETGTRPEGSSMEALPEWWGSWELSQRAAERGRSAATQRGSEASNALPDHWPTRWVLGVPIASKGKILGGLCVAREDGDAFTAADEALFGSFAEISAGLIENAQLYVELHHAALQLEAKVEDRTRELQRANARLEAAMREVEAASLNKSAFLANMSHEIRTPLSSIIGFADLLLQEAVGPLTDKQARYLGHVASSGKHLLQLLNDILDLSKVEAGKFTLQFEALSVAEILDDVLVIARGLATQKGQRVEAQIAPDLPPLRADPVRFKQILFNLLSNAVKFTPARGQITLVARPRPTTPALLEIQVTDTGVGIRPEDLPRLFWGFVQLETTQAQRHEGTGLGLALCKRLVELHGGAISAQSEGEGKGTTIVVLLPFGGPETARVTAEGEGRCTEDTLPEILQS